MMKEPKIRFKGFRGEWETHSLAGTEFSIIAGGDIDRTIFKKCGNYPVIANAITCDGILGYYENSYRVKGPAVTVTGRGEVGVAVPRHYSFTPVVRLLAIKSSHNVDILANAINLCKVPIESTGIPQLTTSKLQEYNVFMPQTLDEEDKLASYFQHLDSLIQSTTKKIESLKQVKAASLQSMFPQEGETTPRVRFKGFEGEWKKVKFGEIAIISRGLTYAPFNLRDKGVRVLRSSNINEDVFVISENDVFVNEECINIEYAEEGNILVTAANGSPRLVGKHAIINNIGTNTTVVGGFMLLISSNESAFLNASMSSSWYSKFLKVGVAGGNGAIGNLSKQELEDTELLIPNKKDERNYIASYFTNLDRQITLHTQRLEKLKQIKSACLDNMFV